MRRMLLPAVVAACGLAAITVRQALSGWNSPSLGDSVRTFAVIWWAYAAVAAALAIGLARLRTTRSAVVDVFADLGSLAASPALGPALARALGDPSLTLLTWSPGEGAYVDREGGTTAIPSGDDRAVTRIERAGEPVAVLVHDPALLEDPGLVDAVAAAVRLTADNERLNAELQAQLEEVAASRARIVVAADAERLRIERDLHDGIQQRLVTIALALRLAEQRLESTDADPTQQVLDRAVTDLASAIDELRDLARGIHPAILTESGLGPALASLADRSPVPVRLSTSITTQPPADVAAAAYFTVAEALTNVAKHASAQTVTVSASNQDGHLQICIADDGQGGADERCGSGLTGISDRIATVGGRLRIDSPCGGGTRLTVELPCASS